MQFMFYAKQASINIKVLVHRIYGRAMNENSVISHYITIDITNNSQKKYLLYLKLIFRTVST